MWRYPEIWNILVWILQLIWHFTVSVSVALGWWFDFYLTQTSICLQPLASQQQHRNAEDVTSLCYFLAHFLTRAYQFLCFEGSYVIIAPLLYRWRTLDLPGYSDWSSSHLLMNSLALELSLFLWEKRYRINCFFVRLMFLIASMDYNMCPGEECRLFR